MPKDITPGEYIDHTTDLIGEGSRPHYENSTPPHTGWFCNIWDTDPPDPTPANYRWWTQSHIEASTGPNWKQLHNYLNNDLDDVIALVAERHTKQTTMRLVRDPNNPTNNYARFTNHATGETRIEQTS